ncbi:hypothetical protein QUB75_16695 [Microcoleus sp. K1-B6]|uniref:hypothetical protein n=1 Tax=Microcoleus sp. K1-B1 TaxID=2818782 RepID=UPI002FD6F0B4
MNRQDACSTKDKFSCGTGILPVADNGARCELPGAKGNLGRSTPQARSNSFNIKKQ